MLNKSFVTRLAVFVLVLAFTAGCAAQPAVSSITSKTDSAAPGASVVVAGAGAPAAAGMAAGAPVNQTTSVTATMICHLFRMTRM